MENSDKFNPKNWNIKERLEAVLSQTMQNMVRNTVLLHAGVSQATYYNVLAGVSKDFKTIGELAQTLGITIDQLIDPSFQIPTPQSERLEEIKQRIGFIKPHKATSVNLHEYE